LKKKKGTITADQMLTIKKHTKTKKELEKEIIQFLNEASTKGNMGWPVCWRQ